MFASIVKGWLMTAVEVAVGITPVDQTVGSAHPPLVIVVWPKACINPNMHNVMPRATRTLLTIFKILIKAHYKLCKNNKVYPHNDGVR